MKGSRSSEPTDHDHDHDHPHAEISQTERPGYYDIMETAVRELLIEKKLFGADEIRHQIEVLDSRTPALGAKVVARAWIDPAFKRGCWPMAAPPARNSASASTTTPQLIVLENTETVHNLIVCTLCSCYPRPVLGLPPDWYKLKPYRARAVIEPRAVLAEFGTHHSRRRRGPRQRLHRDGALPGAADAPEGHRQITDEEQLAALVTRDAMIGVIPVSAPNRKDRAMTQTENLRKTPAERYRRPAGEPIQRIEHELEPWEKRCHALADVLDFHKIINTEEKRCGVEALGAEMVGKLTYYERWIVAFANILFRKGILTPTELALKIKEIEARWARGASRRARRIDDNAGARRRLSPHQPKAR